MKETGIVKFLRQTTPADILQHRPPGWDSKEGLFGVELEVEGRRLPADVFGWVNHADASLRGEAQEYVSHGPVNLQTLGLILDNFDTACTNQRTVINPSYRASTHVHYNVLWRPILDIIRQVIFFTAFEPVILSMCGPTRNGNLFCMSSYDTGDYPRWLASVLTCRQVNLKKVFSRGKYSALNVNPVMTQGTLEFRAFPTYVSKEETLKWCRLIHKILSYPIKGSASDIIDLVLKRREEYVEYFFSLADLPGNWQSLIGFGCEHAWPMAAIFDEHVPIQKGS
jgi:hypothetical protein